jgi:hypothetical protein
MGRVFISYSTEDAATARRVADAFRAGGVDIWIAPDSIRPGEAYNEAIVAGLRSSDAVAVLVSKASNVSKHVAREVGLADSQGKRIIPVRIEAVEPSDGLTYYLSLPQWVEWHAQGASALSPVVALFGAASVPPSAVPVSLQPASLSPTADGAVLEIRRRNQMSLAARNLAVLVDGEKVGEVGNGGTAQFRVAPGRRELAARVDYTKSQPFAVDAASGRVSVVEISVPDYADLGGQLAGLLGQGKFFTWKLLG